jgi:hypothetical protein
MPSPLRPLPLVPAIAEQIEENGLSTHCEKESAARDGPTPTTSTRFSGLFGHRTDEARRLILDALVGVEHDRIWIPTSPTSRDEARGGGRGVHFVERSVAGTCEMCDC